MHHVKTLVAVLVLVLIPTLAFAQASLAGVVRDASGAVLPGVTVEASSPALIERVRTVVTDGNGQYRVVDLRPGTYSVAFTLPGFSSVRREGIELSGSLTATVNAEMRVGAVTETITVTGTASVVDVQTVTQQRVMDKEIVDALPSGRTATNVAVLIPGINLSTTFSGEGQDVGGTTGDVMQSLTIHGSRGSDQRQMLDGINLGSETGGGGTGGFSPNMGSVQEVTVDTSAVSAEQVNGGVRVNLIPREGGNTFRGSLFMTGGTNGLQGSNLDDELRARNVITPNELKSNYDINPALGGPLLRDRLWFFSAARWYAVNNYVSGSVLNANAGDPSSWTYAPDSSFRGSRDTEWQSYNTRITWQVNQKNKLSLFWDQQKRCSCYDMRQLVSPEASVDYRQPWMEFVSLTYSAPLTNRILIDGAYAQKPDDWGYFTHKGAEADEQLIGVTDQATGLSYRGPRVSFQQSLRFNAQLMDRHARASMSYVTGAHSAKFGYNQHWGDRTANYNIPVAHGNLNYTFANGNPTAVTLRAPYSSQTQVTDGGLYAQDRWTAGRITVSGAVRWDFYSSSFPEQTLGPAPYTPNRNVTFPASSFTRFNDITPRVSVAYDLFGNGRTAVKASISKFVEALSYSGVYGDGANPVQRTVQAVNRAWNDLTFGVGDPRTRNFAPDCDLLNPAANGECGPISNQAFGNPVPSINYDPAITDGWGKRGFNWEGSVGVQQELVSNVALDVGYFRRWYGNFLATDNTLVTAADFDQFSVVAPTDSRLPGGGGHVVSNLYNVVPARFGQTNNLLTFAENFGTQMENWQGVDVTLNARLAGGVIAQGGLSTGRTLTDNCAIREALPELSVVNPYCRVETPYLTQVKVLGSYTIPRIEVLTSATFQSIAGPQLAANVVYPSAIIAQSLGRPLSGNAPNATINVVPSGTMYGDRLNQVDMRIGKVFRFGARRATVNVDLFNAFNANPVLTENSNYAVWRQPLSILNARLIKFSGNIDF
jgi:hypothetical protein